ncbi:hypothetical protein [Algicella marina]|uniref:Uncharacterized protein n=1 Tax=Algicella marina TaxID=2683284 RepID=A0A6P1T131_9RHOB|nr:hypothetical protein [Algicella marina]QHQ35156.1 hypothetical protein GO499_08070 [Algicella marina]
MIRARCHPALEAILPKPVPAKSALPDWFRSMPSESVADSLGGASVRTLKHCPPFIDALSTGILMPLAADLRFDDGHVSWDWDPPFLPDTALARAPVSVHVPEQASGAPLEDTILKFMNFWALETPPGWSLLFTHPLNREDLPFRTLSGLVDCDSFADGYVHFPALWLQPGFSGILPAGTPVAQVIAVPRDGSGLIVETMTDGQISVNRQVQEAIGAEPGVYRKRFRH